MPPSYRRIGQHRSGAAPYANQTTAASSIRVATRFTIVRLPCPEFETLLVVTRHWLSSSATSRRTAEGSRASASAKTLNAIGSVVISRNRRSRAGVITSKKSVGSSNERWKPGLTVVPRSSSIALSFMREKKSSIDSTPTREGTVRLARARFKILADLRFKLTFELFIGFKLHTIHTIHTPKIVPVMLSVGIVVAHNSPIV
jgi:hypothetical protein